MDNTTPEILTDILHQLPNAIFALQLEDKEKKEFRIIVANDANEIATGVSWDPFIGKVFRDVFPDIYNTPLPDIYVKVIETKNKIEIGETEYGDSKIRRQTLFVTANPVRSDILVISYENISTLEKVNAELNRKNKEYEGPGIGLAHSKKIIDLHDGVIWIEPEPGKGSTFYFSIPK